MVLVSLVSGLENENEHPIGRYFLDLTGETAFEKITKNGNVTIDPIILNYRIKHITI